MAVLPRAAMSREEHDARQWLNEHVIAVSNDGRAIEPYGQFAGPTPINLGVIRYHKGVETPLQVSGVPGQKLWDAAARATGLEAVAPARPLGGDPRQFFYRDVVVPNMLKRARESGKPIVIFAHGGLNYRDTAIGHAWTFGHGMEQEVYPIFICWDSSFSSSYWQHLWGVRNGVNIANDNSTWARVTGPVYFATDIATSLTRLPRTALDLMHSGIRSMNWAKFGDVQDATGRYYAVRHARGEDGNGWEPWEDAEREALDAAITRGNGGRKLGQMDQIYAATWDALRRRPVAKSWEPLHLSKGELRPTGSDTAKRVAGYFGLLPVKLAGAGFLGGAGNEMWGVMTRRTRLMFHHEASVRPFIGSQAYGSASGHFSEADADVATSESTGIGAMAVFLRRLEDEQKRGRCLNVTPVGHSMGAMVFNEALKEFPSVHYRRIVYMADAGSVRDTTLAVIPYLARPDHAKTEFFSMSLHPRAEDRERPPGGELLPRGSLLIWIDEFLGRPQGFTDRTFGHFENAVLASRIFPPSLQKRVHLTALSAGPALPALQHHGDFSSYAFWRKGFVEDRGEISRDDFDLQRARAGQTRPESAVWASRWGTPTKPAKNP